MKKDILSLIGYLVLVIYGTAGSLYLFAYLLFFGIICGSGGRCLNGYINPYMSLIVPFFFILHLVFPAILTLIALKFKWSKYINRFFDNLLYPTILLIIFIPNILSFCTKKDNSSIFTLFHLPYVITYFSVLVSFIFEKFLKKDIKMLIVCLLLLLCGIYILR